ncbi:MAG TPA: sulfite exporter TauE/SafE family protein [candidate division Zixibacteria bacterium]|nr:sulfite exporter TauE/SafE family protein [candidate division Zixibacteria bacterium]
MPTDLIWYISCGLVAGMAGGFLGIGGGVLLVPLLTVAAGLSVHTAVPVSITAVAAHSFASSNIYLKQGRVDLELALPVVLLMTMGSVLGGYLHPIISPHWVELLLAAMMIYTALSLIFTGKRQDDGMFEGLKSRNYGISAILAAAIGFLAGLIGVGGGELLVPILYSLARVPFKTARGTALLIISFSAAAASAVYFLEGAVEPRVLAPVLIGVIAGSQLGSFLGMRTPSSIARFVYIGVMAYLAYAMSAKGIEGFL